MAPGCASVDEKVASHLKKIQEDASVAEERIEAIAALGAPAAPKLVEALNDPQLRVHAVKALGKIGAPAVPALAKALEGANPTAGRNIANALRELGPDAREAVPALAKALGHSDGQVRAAAASALGAIGPGASGAAGALAGLLVDASADVLVREAGARGLGGVLAGGDGSAPSPEEEKCVMALAQALNHDANEQVRLQAGESLGKIGSKAMPALPAIQQAASAHPSGETRAMAIKALGEMKAGDAKSLDIVFRGMSDPNLGARRNAVWSLGEIGAPAAPAIPGLGQLAAADPRMDEEIQEAIGKIEAGLRASGK
jgi:HEAT repeat protein